MNARFFNPTDVRWCPWQQVGEVIPAPPLKILIISARSSQFCANQLCSELLRGYSVAILPNVPADPTVTSVQGVTDTVKREAPDWIIAIGGGSVIDTAKAAAVIATNHGDVEVYLRSQLKVESPGIPLIAIPTTAGSGSEVTPYASITDTQNMRKISLTHDYLYPKYALLDPVLATTIPQKQTAVSGMDALSHAIEGYWSNRATRITDSCAVTASSLLLSTLETAYRNSWDINARSLTLEGSMLAGLTISNARTTAVHAISYPMTVFFHVPHGLACSLLLPPVIRYNTGAMNKDKEQRLLHSLGLHSMNDLAQTVEHLQNKLELPVRLRDLGITKKHISKIVENGFRPDRMGNNPREITAVDLTAILEEIL